MVTSNSRFRTELTDVAWGYEEQYGIPAPKEEMGAVANTTKGKYMRQWGLVTGGITLPNPRYEFQQYMGIGVDSRNMLFPIRGTQTMEGAVGGVLLCHNSSRYIIEAGLGIAFNATNRVSSGGALQASIDGTITITASNIDAGGDGSPVWTVGNAGHGVANIDLDAFKTAVGTPASHIIMIGPNPAQVNVNPYTDTWAFIGEERGGDDVFAVYKDRGKTITGFNGKVPTGGPSTAYAVYSVERSSLTSGSPAASTAYRYVDGSSVDNNLVIVREALTQQSFTLSARFNADDGANFSTTYTGNKIGSMSFAFSEGEPATLSVNFIGKDMRHNIGERQNGGGQVANIGDVSKVQKYAAQFTEGNYDVGDPGIDDTVAPAPVAETRITEQPYFFSNAVLKLRDTEFVRFRSFNVNIDNGLDPRYYVRQNAEGTPNSNQQIISEILEGRRNITFSGSLDVDSKGPMNAANTNPDDAQLLQYLLNQGADFLSGGDVRNDPVLSGIKVEITLERVANADNVSGTASNTTTLGANLGGAAQDTTVTVAATANLEAGEIINVGSENMRVESVNSGTVITVTRGVNGTTRASHSNSAAVQTYGAGYAPYDKMVLTMPSSGTVGAATPGLVMRSATMDIAGPPQIHQAMDIDGFASSISVKFYDNAPGV